MSDSSASFFSALEGRLDRYDLRAVLSQQGVEYVDYRASLDS